MARPADELDRGDPILDGVVRALAVGTGPLERATLAAITKTMRGVVETLKAQVGLSPSSERARDLAIARARQITKAALELTRDQTLRAQAEAAVAAEGGIREAVLDSVGVSLRALSSDQVAAVVRRPYFGWDTVRWMDWHETTTAARLDRGLRAAYLSGEGYDQIARRLEKLGGLTRNEAMVTARTAIQSAGNEAAHALYQANADAVDREIIVATLDNRTCPICGPLDGTVIPVDGRGDRPPFHAQCVTGDSVVASGAVVTGASERFYDGEVVRVRTASGQHLRCTPNHPALTDRGWLAARFIHKGSYVIRSLRPERVGLRHPNHHEMPARIEEVARALHRAGDVFTRSVPVSSEDFHGDGEGSKVAVVGAYRLLRNGIHSPLCQHSTELDFGGRSVAQAALAFRRYLRLSLDALGLTPAGGVRFGNLAAPLLWRHALPLELLCFALSAWADAGLDEQLPRENTGYPEPSRADVLRVAGQVERDKVIGVDFRAWSGHVYNLQTDAEFYVSSGILTHNCRCMLAPLPAGYPIPKTRTWAQWFPQQSAATQDKVVGKGIMAHVRAGRVGLDDLVTEGGRRRTLAEVNALAAE